MASHSYGKQEEGDRKKPEPMEVNIFENFLKIYFTNGMFGKNVVSDCHHHCSCPCIPKVTIITDMWKGLQQHVSF